ncbi:MAG TPA: RING finger protein [Candidatus Sulfomarinibacteraceae bacterium]|nr:RING finger protein [Candidatus Sulfomarinibacteraceae bacterium]
MAIRPILIDKQSPFLGESCALCKEPFAPGQEIIVCPEDATRHHVHCWRANNDRCAAYGCSGGGDVIRRTPYVEDEDDVQVVQGEVVIDEQDEPASKVRTLPSSSFSCAQGCLILAIAISIIIFALSCFGLWAILDYIMIERLGWHYRDPISWLPHLYVLVTTLPSLAIA